LAVENPPDSAVKVFPTPGSPLRSITIPWPISPVSAICGWSEVIPTFSLNDIVDYAFVWILVLGERQDEIFVTRREDEVVKGLVVPHNFLDAVNLEFGYDVLLNALHGILVIIPQFLFFKEYPLTVGAQSL